MIVLCSKCYYVDEQDSENKKFSMKGCRRDRITSLSSVSKRRLTAVLIEHKTEDFVWLKGEWLLMSSRNWA